MNAPCICRLAGCTVGVGWEMLTFLALVHMLDGGGCSLCLNLQTCSMLRKALGWCGDVNTFPMLCKAFRVRQCTERRYPHCLERCFAETCLEDDANSSEKSSFPSPF